MKIVAIVPAFNEASTIAEVVDGLRNYVSTVIVVDDGSEDDTYGEAKRAGAFLLRHIINRGQGAALQTGTEMALRLGADVIVHFDADGQHEASDLPQVIAPIQRGGVDVVLGSRFLGKAPNMPFLKRIILKIGILFTRVFSGLWLSDVHNGLRAFSKKAAEHISLTQDGMAHGSEIIDIIANHKLAYLEVPVTVHYTQYSLSRGQKGINSLSIVKKLIVSKFFN